jgi:hypothetical protein
MGRARYFFVAVALALTACGDDSGPDVSKIERDLAAGVEADTGTRDVAVECPDDVAEGDACDVTAAGGVKAQVRVTRLDDEAEGELVQP